MKDDPQSETREVFGWHFVPSDRRLAYGDRRLVVDGETLSVDGEVVMCRNGLHLSERAIDAFKYGRLPVVCRVAGSGYSQHGSDKAVFRSRRCVWSADAGQVLVRFSAWCAERAKTHAAASASAAAYAAASASYAAASASAFAADTAADAAYASTHAASAAAYAASAAAYAAAFAVADAAYASTHAAYDAYAAASASYAAASAADAAERVAQNEWLTGALWELAPVGHRRAIA